MYRIGIFLLALMIGVQFANAQETGNPILVGSIGYEPLKQMEAKDQVQPGTSVKLKVEVKNKGKAANKPGKIYLRFSFVKPLESESNSVIFQTEQVDLPAIQPEGKVEIHFEKTHQWPSILDFVRYDWSMREYQAIVVIENKESMIGSLAITYSAYYYPGIRKELPVIVPVN